MISQSRVSKDRRIERPAAQTRRGACIALISAMLLTAVPHGGARAADWLDDSLRGSFSPSSSVRWDGINLGVQAGLTSMDTDFGGSTGQQVAYILRNSTLENEAHPSSWTTLPHNITNSRNYGGFLGYSTQYDQLVLGVDAAYNRMSSAEAQASDSMTRIVTTSDTVQHTVTIAAQSSMKLIDYATARVRAGYAFGQFLPYAFVGGAVGRFNYTNTSTVTDSQLLGGVTSDFGPVTQADSKNNAVVGGFTAGLGMDVALLPNVFLRGEWEYVGFAPVNGIRSSINTGRVAIGMRF
jgi:opacity protein-like surface antigen